MDKGSMIWFDGKIAPAHEAQVSLFTHSLHYGVAAFEGIRAYAQSDGSGAIFRLKEHIERLLESLHILYLKCPYTVEQIMQACIETCQANQYTECYLRPLIYIGDGSLGVYPGPNPKIHVAVMAWKWGSYLGDKAVQTGARLKISSFIRPHANTLMTKGKITGQYVNSVLAKTEARSLGFDEALLLDENGFLTEGSGENLFIVKNGKVKTTPIMNILNGITRATVLDILKHEQIEYQEYPFTRDELWCADEIFLSGTAAEITPVAEVDLRKITNKSNSNVTQTIQAIFSQVVRGKKQIPASKNWLTSFRLPRISQTTQVPLSC